MQVRMYRGSRNSDKSPNESALRYCDWEDVRTVSDNTEHTRQSRFCMEEE